MKTIYEQWVNCLSEVSIKPISDDAVSRLLAIVYIYSGSMELIFNTKLKTDIFYAQKRAGLTGGEIPDKLIIDKTKHYINEIEAYLKNASHVDSISPFDVEHPQWVINFMSERYNINKMWI